MDRGTEEGSGGNSTTIGLACQQILERRSIDLPLIPHGFTETR